jgi:hypothetical protein
MSDLDLPTRPRLPDLALPAMAGGDPVPLRAHRRAAVLVLLAGALDPADAAYLGALADAAPGLTGWDGRVLAIAPDAALGPALDALALPFPVIVDVDGRVAAAAGVAAPALVVADQWGEVHLAAAAAEGWAWPPVAEVERWLQFLAVRCAG